MQCVAANDRKFIKHRLDNGANDANNFAMPLRGNRKVTLSETE
jgi:hypothetical protein